MITTNAYAVVPFHIGAERFAARGEELAALAGRLARAEAAAAGRPVRVAGSLPPVFGSYRPDLFVRAEAAAILDVLVRGQAPYVDVWLAETQSAIEEAEAAARAVAATGTPLWLSFTLADEGAEPRLRSGEPVADAARAALRLGAEALLFNCSQPERMAAALAAARAAAPELALGAYANAFPPLAEDHEANDGLTATREDLDPPGYLGFARAWVEAGATLVGGCCGIGPAQIEALARGL